jgi:hypothetical protein
MTRLAIVGAVLLVGCKRGAGKEPLVTNPKGQFGADSAETQNYLNGLDFTIASTGDSILVAQYPCANPASCPAGGVWLMFVPEQHAEQRDWKNDMKKNAAGDVVAMVINIDSIAFPDLGLAPKKIAYAWVGQNGPDPINDRGFGVYRLGPNGLTAGSWFVSKDVQHCDNPATRGKPAIKDHHPGSDSTCVPIVAKASFGVKSAYASTTTRSLMLSGGLWISCSGGCCQVSKT